MSLLQGASLVCIAALYITFILQSAADNDYVSIISFSVSLAFFMYIAAQMVSQWEFFPTLMS